MDTNELKPIIQSIIRTRKFLIKSGKSDKNQMRCLKYIETLQKYIDAYGGRWNREGWKKFVSNHMNEIIYLIPVNKSGETIKQKMYALL